MPAVTGTVARMSFEVWLLTSLVTGLFGLAYFVYGKKQAKPVPLITGLALMLFPYAVDSLLWTIIIGLALIMLPFIYRPE